MAFWRNLKIGVRLGIGIGILLLLLAAVAGAAFFSLNRAKTAFTEFRGLSTEATTAYNWNGDLLAVRLAVRGHYIYGTEETQKNAEVALKVLSDELAAETAPEQTVWIGELAE